VACHAPNLCGKALKSARAEPTQRECFHGRLIIQTCIGLRAPLTGDRPLGRALSSGSAPLADLRAFPAEVRRMAGHELHLVQQGLEPDDWKAMASVGAECTN